MIYDSSHWPASGRADSSPPPLPLSTFDPDPTQFYKVGPREIQKLMLRLLFSLYLSKDINFCIFNTIIYAQQGNIIKSEKIRQTQIKISSMDKKNDLKATFLEETFNKTMLLVFQYHKLDEIIMNSMFMKTPTVFCGRLAVQIYW